MPAKITMFLFLLLVVILTNSYAQTASAIQGEVSEGVLPIANARVMVLADTSWVTTNQEGRFRLPVHNRPGELIPVTAGKFGWFNNGAEFTVGSSDASITLESIPSKDNPGYYWIDPQSSGGGMMGMMGGSTPGCGNCHDNYYRWWSTSTMAKTTSNPLVLRQYQDAGKAKGMCADCHAPGAAVHNPGNTDLQQVSENGGVEASGVFCDFCHKTKNVTVGINAGVQAVELNRLTLPRRSMGGMGMMGMQPVLAYGDLVDVVTPPMAAGFNPQLSSSDFCSSCHLDGIRLEDGKQWDYKSVYPDAAPQEFENGSVVPNQWTYQEWKNWQDGLPQDDPNKGQQCQNCHMNWTKDMLPYDEYIVEGSGGMWSGMIEQWAIRRQPSTIHPHKFEGATADRLQNTAFLFMNASLQDNRLSVMISVTNTNTGHLIPTGVTFRNILLIMEAMDSTGKVLELTEGPRIPEWGGNGNPAKGNYAGLPGTGFARITADDQNNLNVPFWRATKIVRDNRIAPQKQAVNNFVFNASSTRNYITVTARLVYRKVFKPMADQYGWNTGDILMEKSSKTVYK